jgi:glucose/arabinose dehydrogenase
MTLTTMTKTFVSLAAALGLAVGATAAAAQALKPVTVARGLQNPWGLAFLPDGRMLVSERPGRLRVVAKDGTLGAPLAGLPKIDVGGQGGLLDVAVDPQFANNRTVWFSFSEPAEGGQSGNSTAVARATLDADANRLADVRVVWRQQPKVSSSAHFGSRLVFARDGMLFVTLGDRFSRKDDAQALDTHHGKIVRIDPATGRAAPGNPFAGKAGALPEIWSIGHRNVQGAALHPDTGELWTHEHGPQGGDELNVVAAGRNYGWPRITFGRNYGTGTKIGEGTEGAGVEPPLTVWIPSIAPSGMAFVTSDRYPGWKGQLFVGALRGTHLQRLELDGRKVVARHTLLTDFNERIRDVVEGPDGWLYVVTDSSDGRIVRLER